MKNNLKDVLLILCIVLVTLFVTECTRTNPEPIKTDNKYLYEVIYQQQMTINKINDSLHVLNDSNAALKEIYINTQHSYLNSLEAIKSAKIKTIVDTVEIEVYKADIVEQFIKECDSLNLVTMKVIETKDLLIDQLELKINELEYTEDVYKTMISNHIENEKAAIKRHKKQKRKAIIGGLSAGFITGLVVGGIIF